MQIEVTSDMILALVPLVVLQLVLAIICIRDMVRNHGAKHMPVYVWVPIVLLLQLIGPVSYFIFGRKDENSDM